MTVRVSYGFSQGEAEEVARLFWQAFRSKLAFTLAPDDRAIAFLTRVLNPEYAFVARGTDDAILGVVGLKVGKAGMVTGGLKELAEVYGWPGALWRGILLSLLERELAEDELMIDGLFVSEAARGLGVGTALVHAVKAMARDKGFQTVQLEVVNSNPRAKALYSRERFQATDQQDLGLLKHVFGFQSATRMVWTNTAAGNGHV